MLPVHCQARRQLAASSQSLDLCAVQQHGLWGMGESGTRALQDQYESAALVVDVGVRGRLVGGSFTMFCPDDLWVIKYASFLLGLHVLHGRRNWIVYHVVFIIDITICTFSVLWPSMDARWHSIIYA